MAHGFAIDCISPCILQMFWRIMKSIKNAFVQFKVKAAALSDVLLDVNIVIHSVTNN